MDAITSQVDVTLTDARRAAVPGAIGDALDRSGAIIAAPIAGLLGKTAPSASNLSVAIDGAGLFVLDDGGKRTYGRLGDFTVNSHGMLVDGRGRAVLGVAASDKDTTIERLAPIRIDAEEPSSNCSIDDRGFVSGLRAGKRETIARIALALFPAPERLKRVDETTVGATAAAGGPLLHFPGSSNVGALRSHALETALVDLEGDLARIWSLRRRGELLAAHAHASDECVREALGLVK